MKYTARLIYKSVSTCFSTSLPVYFYGLPNNSMLVIFASSTNEFQDDSTLKWIVAEHLDFSYDYETASIYTTGSREIGTDEFMELADNLEQRIKTIATFGNFSNNTEALQYFNINYYRMLINQNQEKYAMEYF